MAAQRDDHLTAADLLHFLWIAGQFPNSSQPLLHLVLRCPGCCRPGPVDHDAQQELESSHFDDRSLGALAWTLLGYGNPRLAEALEHLCRQCPRCWKLAEPLFRHQRTSLSAEESVDLVAQFHRLTERQNDGGHVFVGPEVRSMVEDLLAQPHGRRRLLVNNSRRFHSPRMVDALCEASCRIATHDATESARLARLARELTQQLEPALHGRRVVEDLLALSHAAEGNALRVARRTDEAEKAFDRADAHRLRGTNLAIVRAEIDLLRASLFAARRAFSQGRRLLEHAASVFEELGVESKLRVLRIKESHFCREAGEPDEALRILAATLPGLKPERDGRLLLCALQNQLAATVDAGRHHEAKRLLPAVQTLSDSTGSELDGTKLRWLEAEIALGCRQLSKAEAILTRLRQDFRQQEEWVDAGLVSLNLCELYLQQHRPSEVPSLASEAQELFRDLGVDVEAARAARLLAVAQQH